MMLGAKGCWGGWRRDMNWQAGVTLDNNYSKPRDVLLNYHMLQTLQTQQINMLILADTSERWRKSTTPLQSAQTNLHFPQRCLEMKRQKWL